MDNKTRPCSVFNPDFSETVAYNNPLFPAYVVYGFLTSYPDYSSISHWHKDLEFILIKKGAMTYNVNGRLIDLAEGSPLRKMPPILTCILSGTAGWLPSWKSRNIFIIPLVKKRQIPCLILNWWKTILQS